MADARDILLAMIGSNFDRMAWYGGTLLTALRKTDHRMATRHVAGLKTIAEQALHAAYWKHIAIRRLGGDKKRKFAYPGSNWPRVPSPLTAVAWKAIIAEMRSQQERLIQTVRDLPESRLSQPAVIRLIHGIASHDVYHNGQIRHLRATLLPRKR